MSLSQIPLDQIFRPRTDTLSSTSSVSPATRFQGMAQPVKMGTRTPQMLEYERQAEERAREAERMQEERETMLESESRIQKEIERIAQEEYEMKQYYEAEALKHAEEVRLHQEEVRRHQQRLREHQQRVLDHEASSEAFAAVIARPSRDRQISFSATRKNSNGSGSLNSLSNGNSKGQAPAQFPSGL
jgi:hypothetical protein